MQPRNRDFNLLIKKDFQFSNLGNLWEKGKRFSCKSVIRVSILHRFIRY